jgi:hypothetical protein
MRSQIEERHDSDENGRPAGGLTKGRGFAIHWQAGPLGTGAERIEPNGAFVEDVIAAARGRIAYYQTEAGGRFACDENADALTCLDRALERLEDRTRDRTARNVEGTHEI